MAQEQLFYDSIEDAIGSVILELGGFKRVAHKLWPSLKLETAYARLKNCLNEEKDEKLSPGELLLIMVWASAIGCYVLQRYIGEETHCEFRPVAPRDQYGELQKQFIASVAVSRELAERLERLSEKVST